MFLFSYFIAICKPTLYTDIIFTKKLHEMFRQPPHQTEECIRRRPLYPAEQLSNNSVSVKEGLL